MNILFNFLVYNSLFLVRYYLTTRITKIFTKDTMLDTGYWILDTGYWILDTGYWISKTLLIINY
jgi:hypothetical protein